MDTQKEKKNAAKKGEIPFLITILSLVGISIIFTALSDEEFMKAWPDEMAYVIGMVLGSGILIVPISAVIALIVWAITQKVSKSKYGFGVFWVCSSIALCGLLYGGKVYMENAALSPRERAKRDAMVKERHLSKIVLSDGSMRWARSYGGNTHTMESVSGTVKNWLNRPIENVTILVEIYNGDDALIDSFEFTEHFRDPRTFRVDPLPYGKAKDFTHLKAVYNIPKDMSWSWGVVGAEYSPESRL